LIEKIEDTQRKLEYFKGVVEKIRGDVKEDLFDS